MQAMEVELGGGYAGVFWFDMEQLRIAAGFVAALVRRLEGRRSAAVGVRDLLDGTDFPEFERLDADDCERVARGEIQSGAVLLDGRLTSYRVTTERAGAGVVYLYVPDERQAMLFDALAAEVAAFRERGHELYLPAMPANGSESNK